MTLHHGAWQDAPWPQEVDVIVTDPPYSAKVHTGHNHVARPGGSLRHRTRIEYDHLTPADVEAWASAWTPRVKYWLCVMCDHALIPHWQQAIERAGLYAFAPVPCVIIGMTCRLQGDGPSSWTVYLMVARTKAAHKWGTLPGAYVVGKEAFGQAAGRRIGGKPLSLMRQIIRDYSRPGMLVADPCAGHATTLVAALESGRRAWGCELDPAAHAAGSARLAGACPPTLPFDTAPEQASLLEIP
jgi:site-specific DNA-methyltransferase (adenine-specific)